MFDYNMVIILILGLVCFVLFGISVIYNRDLICYEDDIFLILLSGFIGYMGFCGLLILSTSNPLPVIVLLTFAVLLFILWYESFRNGESFISRPIITYLSNISLLCYVIYGFPLSLMALMVIPIFGLIIFKPDRIYLMITVWTYFVVLFGVYLEVFGDIHIMNIINSSMSKLSNFLIRLFIITFTTLVKGVLCSIIQFIKLFIDFIEFELEH